MNLIKSEEEIKLTRAAGRILATTLERIKHATSPGMCGRDLEEIAVASIRAADATPSFLGFNNYPAAICVSVNDALVHGLPTDVPFKEGDLIGVDVGVNYHGWNADAAITFGLGQITAADQRLLSVCQQSLLAGIEAVKVGATVGDVGAAVNSVIQPTGLGNIKPLTGHGIGRNLHEPPSIPNQGSKGQGMAFEAGMIICIEPMIAAGSPEIITDPDGWTIRIKDGSNSAHFEHTVLVTSIGSEILTQVNSGTRSTPVDRN